MNKQNINFLIFDNLNKCLYCFTLTKTAINESNTCDCNEIQKFAEIFNVDGYFLSVFIRHLKKSDLYRKLVIRNLSNSTNHLPVSNNISVKFQLAEPKKEVLDYSWNEKLSYLIVERRELEHAMSWLSTLGGAFSALGDSIEKCAKVAGKISVQQFKIAFRLGEPPLVARCKLYMALSLIQLGKLAIAKRIVETQYKMAKDSDDIKLQNMCKGIWAKLQYIYKQKQNFSKKYVT